ncbi:Membrane alanyl aminopeptidase [Trichinella spiralis]|uniref:Membrane alanyl aminopeptidase n=1 Tax=Trichinella spiralis TaxID=6334 RepID=A0ABR3KQQ0_TRISP
MSSRTSLDKVVTGSTYGCEIPFTFISLNSFFIPKLHPLIQSVSCEISIEYCLSGSRPTIIPDVVSSLSCFDWTKSK